MQRLYLKFYLVNFAVSEIQYNESSITRILRSIRPITLRPLNAELSSYRTKEPFNNPSDAGDYKSNLIEYINSILNILYKVDGCTQLNYFDRRDLQGASEILDFIMALDVDEVL